MDHLECSICLDTFHDPVILPSCGHTFCRQCVSQLAETTGGGWFQNSRRGQHACPTCRSPFRLAEVRTNFALRQLLSDHARGTHGQTHASPVRHNEIQARSDRPGELRRLCTREFKNDDANVVQIQKFQSLGVPWGLARLLAEEDRQIGLRIFLLDNSGSTCAYDGHYCEQRPDGTMVMRPCSRWEEIRHMAMEHAHWNATIGTPCEFVLLNPGPGPLQEGRDFVRMHSGSGSASSAIQSLQRMLDMTRPNGPTPLSDRLQEIHQRVQQQHLELVQNGQRVVLVIATDGLPTSARGALSSTADSEKKRFVEQLKRLGLELSVQMVIRLATDEDDVVDFYNKVDEELELPLEVMDDIKSEAKEIRSQLNGWLTYSPLLHKIREGGTFVKLLDLLDERRLTPTEVSVLAQLLLRHENDEPLPRSTEDFCNALAHAVECAPLVYDPLTCTLSPPVKTSEVVWALNPSQGARVVQNVRLLIQTVTTPLQACREPQTSLSELVF